MTNSRHCERSEAIQYCAAKPKAGLLRRFAPRNDGLDCFVACAARNDARSAFRCQNVARMPPLAVMVRLWSDITVPSTAPNSATFLLVW
jgi:hypothetical protein